MRKWKRYFCLLAWMVAAGVSAQVPADSLLLELETCQRLAQDNYPLVRRYDLIEQARAYDLSHAAKGYLPQLSLSGKATYQSETTELPFDIPGIGHIGLPKDQYQVGIEVQQTVWDGGQIRARKRQTEAASEVDAEKQRVDMYAVRERINQLFFGILLLDEQLRQNDILQDDLKRTYDKVVAYMAHGVANQSDVDAVRVEELNASQQRVSLEVSRRAYIQMLGAFIGRNLPEDVSLRKPVPEQEDEQSVAALPGIARPEVGWLAAQERQIDVQESALKTGYLPRLGVFVQGAYGNPGLNMLKDDFSAWFMAGIRLTWNFGSLYTLKDDRRLLDVKRREVEVSRDAFLFNTRLEAIRQDAQVHGLRRQMADDEEIIRLRGNILRTAEAKVKNGTMSVTDLLTEINRESGARLAKALHEVQWLMEIWQRKHVLND